jgi:hypothetical protein
LEEGFGIFCDDDAEVVTGTPEKVPPTAFIKKKGKERRSRGVFSLDVKISQK